MYNIKKNFKSFDVSLDDVNEFIAGLNIAGFNGISGNSMLVIHFESKPSDAEIDAVNSYWDGITEVSDEAANHFKEDNFMKADKKLRNTIVNKDWATLTKVEKKVIMGLEITRAQKKKIIQDHGE